MAAKTDGELISEMSSELSRLREFESAVRTAQLADTDKDEARLVTAAIADLDKARRS